MEGDQMDRRCKRGENTGQRNVIGSGTEKKQLQKRENIMRVEKRYGKTKRE